MIGTVSSVTTANRIKKIMEAKGVSITVRQTPKHLSTGGCGYSVVFSDRDLNKIVETLRDYQISLRAVYDDSKL